MSPNSTGDNMQPCLTPLPTTEGAERVPLCSTQHLVPLYVGLMTDTHLLGISLLLSAIQRPFLSALSKTFSKSTKTRWVLSEAVLSRDVCVGYQVKIWRRNFYSILMFGGLVEVDFLLRFLELLEDIRNFLAEKEESYSQLNNKVWLINLSW